MFHGLKTNEGGVVGALDTDLVRFTFLSIIESSCLQNDDGESRSSRGHKDYRSRPPPRDYPPRRWKEDYQRPVSARNKETNSKESASSDDKFRNKVRKIFDRP